MGESEEAEETPKRGFVWISTEESFDARQVSVLACIEVVLAIWLYWWVIPVWFDTQLHLLVSVAIAPLLLLRSPESILAALDLFQLRWGRDHEPDLLSKNGLWIAFFSAILAFFASRWLSDIWLNGYVGWMLFWRSGAIGILSVNLAYGVTFAGKGAGARTSVRASSRSLFIAAVRMRRPQL